MQFFSGLQDLLFPPHCSGCGLPGATLCINCQKSFRLDDYQSYTGKISVFSAANYNPVTRRILLAAKEDGVRAADDLIFTALHHSISHALQRSGNQPILVPIPSAPRAVRARGRDFVAEITKRLSQLIGLPTQNLLRHNRKVSDQSRLDATSRFKNIDGAIMLTKRPVRLHEVFLIDDLLTTGATLNEAVRTLEMNGFRVTAAVTALVSLPLR